MVFFYPSKQFAAFLKTCAVKESRIPEQSLQDSCKGALVRRAEEGLESSRCLRHLPWLHSRRLCLPLKIVLSNGLCRDMTESENCAGKAGVGAGIYIGSLQPPSQLALLAKRGFTTQLGLSKLAR